MANTCSSFEQLLRRLVGFLAFINLPYLRITRSRQTQYGNLGR